MSNLYCAAEYTSNIINLMLKDKNLITLINPNPSECENIDIIDVLLGGTWHIDGKEYKEQGHIFDYNFVDETVTQEKTFIFVDTNIDSIANNTFTDFILYVAIFTDKSLVRINSSSTPTATQLQDMGYYSTGQRGNRIFALCDCVDNILNGCNKLKTLGEITPYPRNHMSNYFPNNKYWGKMLIYHVKNYNPGGNACENR